MSKEKVAVIFDTETTGLIKPEATTLDQQPYITELYAAKVIHRSDGIIEQVDEFDSLFKVPVPLDPMVIKITGLTDEDLADQPTFRQQFTKLAEFFTGADRMVAHNLPFDRSMVANELSRIGKVINFPWPMDHVCTVQKTLHIEQRRMSLTRLHEHLFGEGFPDAHRAKNDVLPLFRCYKELVKQGVIA